MTEARGLIAMIHHEQQTYDQWSTSLTRNTNVVQIVID